MNTVFPSKTRRLAAKAVVSMFVLVALACVTTPLTAFACDQPHFAIILKGFCQAFKADLKTKESLRNREFNKIINGASVKEILERKKGLSDSDVESFERAEISIANDDFNAGTTYAPDACQLGTRDTATDKNDFQSYFNSPEYAGLDGDTIDSMFTAAVQAVSNTTVNSGNDTGTRNPRTDNVVEPRFGHRHRNTPAHPCTDTLVKGSFDPPTNTTFYTLTVGGAPAFCDKVTWNFSNRTAGKDCQFFISPLSQTFTLNFIDSSGQQIASVTTFPGSIIPWRENDVKQVQLDLSNQSNRTLTLGGMWYECQ